MNLPYEFPSDDLPDISEARIRNDLFLRPDQSVELVGEPTRRNGAVICAYYVDKYSEEGGMLHVRYSEKERVVSTTVGTLPPKSTEDADFVKDTYCLIKRLTSHIDEYLEWMG